MDSFKGGFIRLILVLSTMFARSRHTTEFHQTPSAVLFLSPTRKAANSVRGFYRTELENPCQPASAVPGLPNAVCRIHNTPCIPPAGPEARSPAQAPANTQSRSPLKYCKCSREITCTQQNHARSRGVEWISEQ